MKTSILTIAILLGGILSAQAQSTEEYGNNRFALAPITIYGSHSFNEFGVGLSYEHFFNAKVALQSDFTLGA